MRLALLSLLVACAPSAAEMDRDNVAAKNRALQQIAANGTAFTPTAVSIADLGDDTAPRGEGALIAHVSLPANPSTLLGQEHIGALDDGRMVFIGAYCVRTARCSNACEESASYSYGTAADGHVIITRIRPRYDVVATDKDSGCSGSCGGSPDNREVHPSTTGLVLGNLTPKQIEIRDVQYMVQMRERICTNMTPVP
ncbi:MAG TPA: hypothetical protein VF403_08930 [Kofleriaceae bacterium]